LKKDIKVVATELEGDQVRLDVTVDKEDVEDFIDRAYRKVNKDYRIPGFRPGKAPRKVLDNAIGKNLIFAEATDFLLNETYPKAVESESLDVLGDPDIQTDELVKHDLDYVYHVDMHVKPKLELSSYDPVEVELPPEEPTDEEIDKQVDVLRGYYYKLEDIEDVDHQIDKDDFAVVDLTCTRDGEPVEELCVEDRIYELGHARIPADLEAGIIGMKVGEEKDVEFVPAEGQDPVNGHVTIKGVRTKVLPELDDEFAKKSGFDDVAALRKAVADTVAVQKKSAMGRLKEDRALEAIAERLQGEPSDLQVSYIYNDLLKRFFESLQAEGTVFDSYLAEQGITTEQFESDMKKQAREVATQELALDAIVRHEGFECSKDDIIKEFIQAGSKDPEKDYKAWENAGRLNGLRATVMRAKAGRWVEDNAKVVEEKPKDEQGAPASDEPKDEQEAPVSDEPRDEASKDAATSDATDDNE
jgi:trigger factor